VRIPEDVRGPRSARQRDLRPPLAAARRGPPLPAGSGALGPGGQPLPIRPATRRGRVGGATPPEQVFLFTSGSLGGRRQVATGPGASREGARQGRGGGLTRESAKVRLQLSILAIPDVPGPGAGRSLGRQECGFAASFGLPFRAAFVLDSERSEGGISREPAGHTGVLVNASPGVGRWDAKFDFLGLEVESRGC
jgi:hypothetical protein